jgi:hypothetical protein
MTQLYADGKDKARRFGTTHLLSKPRIDSEFLGYTSAIRNQPGSFCVTAGTQRHGEM